MGSVTVTWDVSGETQESGATDAGAPAPPTGGLRSHRPCSAPGGSVRSVTLGGVVQQGGEAEGGGPRGSPEGEVPAAVLPPLPPPGKAPGATLLGRLALGPQCWVCPLRPPGQAGLCRRLAPSAHPGRPQPPCPSEAHGDSLPQPLRVTSRPKRVRRARRSDDGGWDSACRPWVPRRWPKTPDHGVLTDHSAHKGPGARGPERSRHGRRHRGGEQDRSRWLAPRTKGLRRWWAGGPPCPRLRGRQG